jgi:hypothetical protein
LRKLLVNGARQGRSRLLGRGPFGALAAPPIVGRGPVERTLGIASVILGAAPRAICVPEDDDWSDVSHCFISCFGTRSKDLGSSARTMPMTGVRIRYLTQINEFFPFAPISG